MCDNFKKKSLFSVQQKMHRAVETSEYQPDERNLMEIMDLGILPEINPQYNIYK